LVPINTTISNVVPRFYALHYYHSCMGAPQN
jgi:hypothetical protein